MCIDYAKCKNASWKYSNDFIRFNIGVLPFEYFGKPLYVKSIIPFNNEYIPIAISIKANIQSMSEFISKYH